MTSKHQNQMSRRYPLKRVRPDNENQSSTLKTTGRFSKKLCREPSEGFFIILSVFLVKIS